jgi:L-asparagine oxygenase
MTLLDDRSHGFLGLADLGGPDRSGWRALLEHVGAVVYVASVPVTILETEPDPVVLRDLQTHLASGGRAVVAAGNGATPALREVFGLPQGDARTLAVVRADNPLVLDAHVVAEGRGPLAGLRLESDDLVGLADDLAADPHEPVVAVDGRRVVLTVPVGAGTLVLIGSTAVLTNRWIAAADNAVLLAWALTGRVDRSVGGLVRRHLPVAPEARAPHVDIRSVDNRGDDGLVALLPPAEVGVGTPEFLRAAGRAGRLLSAAVHDALGDFTEEGAPAGAILLRHLPVGDVPATPSSPTEATGKDHTSELVLLTVARRVGHPVGYEPEHGGDIVQNLLPTRGDVARQTSTSSGVELEFHTETAFHPHKPRYLLLLCLRGDPEAQTLLCSIGQVLGRLTLGVQQVLREPRFRTGIDESFTGTRSNRLGHALPVLAGSDAAPTFTFDADLMTGTDPKAAEALEELRQAIRAEHVGVALEAGDLLVVDNSVSVHGRSPFTARFDGTDRWLQRTFVVTDLARSATERRGRVITTRFA